MAASASAQRVVGGGEEAEVLRVLVGQGEEPAGSTGGRREVVHGVLDALAAGEHDPGVGERVVRGDGEPFGGVGAVQADQHERRVPGRAGAEREASVGLLEDEHVSGRVVAQLVAPQLEGPLRLVEADVEHEVGRGRPGQAVPRVGHGLGSGGDLGVERAEAQLVLLVAAAVGRVGQPAMVVADRRAADGEILGALGQRVLVEQDLLLLAGLTGRGQLPAAAGGPPAVDAVVLALLGARVVPPWSAAGRHRHVGLLDPGLHLLEEPAAQRGQRRRLPVGIGVLGLQVLQDLGILALAEPEPGVLAVVAVGRDDMGAPGCSGGAGHRMRACHGWRHTSRW